MGRSCWKIIETLEALLFGCFQIDIKVKYKLRWMLIALAFSVHETMFEREVVRIVLCLIDGISWVFVIWCLLKYFCDGLPYLIRISIFAPPEYPSTSLTSLSFFASYKHQKLFFRSFFCCLLQYEHLNLCCVRTCLIHIMSCRQANDREVLCVRFSFKTFQNVLEKFPISALRKMSFMQGWTFIKTKFSLAPLN